MNDEEDKDIKFQEIFETERERTCPYTPEEIQELKAAGAEKPEGVRWGDWVGPEDHSHRHDLIAQLAASGATNNAIAEEIGMTPGRVSIILGQKKMKEKVRQLQREYWGENAEKKFQEILPQAIQVAQEILEDKQAKSNLRADVAFRFMDRALGKAKQTVDVEGNLLGELIHKLDQQETGPRNVGDTKALAQPENPIDTFMDDYLPEEAVVGQRNAPEQEPQEKEEHE